MASLLYGLAGKLLGELGAPIFQDIGKSWGFGTKDEFEKLRSTLSAIEVVLLDAEEKKRTNRHIQDWLMKIKLVFYDVEDLLQEVSTENLKRQVMTRNKKAKEVRIFFSSSNQVKYRLKMGHKVKLIRDLLDATALDSNRFNLTPRHEEMHVVRSKRMEETHSFVPLEKVIGRDKDKDYVTKLLLEPDVIDNVSVISIVGMGGLGKTTLAQFVYSSEEVKSSFELMMWVCVSDVFDVKQICEKIVESATRSKCERLQMDVVKDELKKAIDGRKYLLVLDDLWNENPIEWMKLEELLTGGAKGSKVLITSRAELVSRASKSIATHFLKGLSNEESWALFKQVAFNQGVEPVSSIIVGIGKEVVAMCAGIPLAIKTIGSMLGLKEKETNWLDFQKNDLPRIKQDSEGNIVSILKLSYDYLSAPLKRCFSYCAILPKDNEIKKEVLIRMWIAHGLIQLDGTNRSLEDVGEQHFTDLLDRSLFEVHEKYNNSIIGCYKMHDLIHDLALSVGGNEYCNLGSDVNCIDKATRHAWVRHVPTNLLHAKKLRTLIVGGPRELIYRHSHEEGHVLNEIISNFKQLRVLVWINLNMTSVPRSVDRLRHLNYINFAGGAFDFLPQSICSLYNLQTLILAVCDNLKELPAGINKLTCLRHLDIMGCHKMSCMPSGLGEMTCLQTLSDFVMGPEGRRNCSELGELKGLVNLRGRLTIRNLRGSKVAQCKGVQSRILTHLQLVHRLSLDWSYEEEVKEEEAEISLFESLKPHPNLEVLSITCYGGKKFPGWIDKVNIGVSLPNIVFIELGRCKSWRHLSPFGLLPSLRKLSLWRMDGIECIHDEEEEAWNNNESASTSSSAPKEPQIFPSLEVLYLREMPKLTRLVGPTSKSRLNNNRHFPVLTKLIISSDPVFAADGSDEAGKQFLSLTSLREVEICFSEIETLPELLQYLPQLQTLKVCYCDNMVTLPEWMGNLTSLWEICLQSCKSLASIPDCIQLLTSLQRLEVKRCPNLLGRCEKETGKDWHKIAHIPNIEVKK